MGDGRRRSFEEGGADSCLAGPELKDKAGLHGGACLVPSCRAPSPDDSPSETQEFGCLGPLHEPQLSAASRCNFPSNFPPPLAFYPLA